MLLRGCVVTTTAADPQPFVILRQDFDRVIASVGVEVGRLVRKRILAAKLILNFDEGVRHVGDLERKERASAGSRSEEHTSELQSPLNISYAVFCLKKKNK